MMMIYPLSNPTITQTFGANPGDYLKWGFPGHNGLDLTTDSQPAYVYAVSDGVVEQTAYEAGGYGKYIVVRHPGVWSYYAHLKIVGVKPGQKVAAGGILGVMGSTGNSSAPHLHLGIRLAERRGRYRGYIDPLPLLGGSPNLPQGADSANERLAAQIPPQPLTLPGYVIVGTHGRLVIRMKKHF